MSDNKTNVEVQSNVVDPFSNMAANSPSTQPSEIAPNQHGGVELPPPYSQVPMAQYPNQTGMPQSAQQQYTWNPHQGYPPFPQPGAQQHAQFHPQGFPPQTGPQEVRVQQEHVIRHGIATAVMTRRFVARRSCTWRLTRLGISLFLVGIILLIILGVLIVGPTLNDLRLQRAQCQVLSSEMTTEHKSCDCGRYCTSSYPCLQIQVSYYSSGKRQKGYLYQDVYDDKNKCSVQPCYSEENINYYDVKDFKEDYGTVGQSFACYYNPSTLGEVFVQHADSSSDHMKILHSILWPMLIVVIAASMLGILFCKSKGHCCYKKSGAPVPYQNLQATT